MGIACMEYLSKKYKQEDNDGSKEKISYVEKQEKETNKED